MKSYLKVATLVAYALCAYTAASFVVFAQTQPTLGQQGAQWVQATATALNKVNGDNGKPMQLVSTPDYFVVNGKALYYTDAANMTPDQVVAFAGQTL